MYQSTGFGLGRNAGGSRTVGVQSVGTRVAAWRSFGAYDELRRLTIRGERFASVRVARIRAQGQAVH